MTFAPLETQKMIYNLLSSDQALATLLGAPLNAEIQNILLGADSDHGTFKITVGGDTTEDITMVANKATNVASIQAALRALEGFENTVVTNPSGNNYRINFADWLENLSTLSVSDNSVEEDDNTPISMTVTTVQNGGVVTQKIYDHVPDNTAYPYVRINALPFTDRGNYKAEGFTCEFQINVFYRAPGRGNKDVQTIQNRIDELLHNASVCVQGWNTLGLRRTTIDILTEDDNVTKQGIQIFKLLLGGQ